MEPAKIIDGEEESKETEESLETEESKETS